MKFLVLSPALALADSIAWAPAGSADVRSPCPMLNTLANHGFLPHNGKEITKTQASNVFASILNIADDLFEAFWGGVRLVNGGADIFSLDQLNLHNSVEHDGSLSRQDHHFGNAQAFNQTIFDETRSHWHGSYTIGLKQAARARLARVEKSMATNPAYNNTPVENASLSETAIYLLTLGDRVSGTAPRAFVEYLFERERLPFKLGWTTPSELITFADLKNMSGRVQEAEPKRAPYKTEDDNDIAQGLLQAQLNEL